MELGHRAHADGVPHQRPRSAAGRHRPRGRAVHGADDVAARRVQGEVRRRADVREGDEGRQLRAGGLPHDLGRAALRGRHPGARAVGPDDEVHGHALLAVAPGLRRVAAGVQRPDQPARGALRLRQHRRAPEVRHGADRRRRVLAQLPVHLRHRSPPAPLHAARALRGVYDLRGLRSRRRLWLHSQRRRVDHQRDGDHELVPAAPRRGVHAAARVLQVRRSGWGLLPVQ